MKIFIFYSRIFDFEGKSLTIGGIQTYLLNLAIMLQKNNYSPVIYQSATNNWTIEYKNIPIIGIKINNKLNLKKQREQVFSELLKSYKEDDIVIWGTDTIAIPNEKVNSILIQHGITFDYFSIHGKKYKILSWLGLAQIIMYLERKKVIGAFMNAKIKVCVDYNFLNWIRTFKLRNELENIYVIPNFTHKNAAVKIGEYEKGNIRILFARRFTMARGVYILEKIIKEITKKYTNVSFTIAGDGELKSYVIENIGYNPKVDVIQYEHSDSLKIHAKHDIALVPSFGSEGTSLSLLEAMTSGCIPIASNVGGMTNIILDNYNGFLVNPEADEFIEKIELLIENKKLRTRLRKNAKDSADEAFSYEIWQTKWLKVIENTCDA